MPLMTQSFSYRLFHEFFPPPKFLEMPAVGLDISDTAVTVLELVRHRSAYAVGRYGRRALPRGAISGGYISDKNAVVAELSRLKEELRLDFVNASFSEEKAYLFTASIPRVAKREIRGLLEFKLEENVPIPAAEAVFDYAMIPQRSHAPQEHIDVSVTVLPRAVVGAYTETLSAAGLTPLSFEIEAQAIARAVTVSGERGAYLIAHFGEEKTGLFIVSDEAVQFTSTVAVGGKSVRAAFAARLGARVRGGSARPDALAVLKDEVQKLSVYWRTHTGPGGDERRSLNKVLLTGRDAAVPELDDYLARFLSLPVAVGNVWQNLFSFDEYIPPIPFAESLEYGAAVGLALPKSH